MKKAYSLTLALGVIVGSLSSCSRTDYAFNPQTPAYLGATHATAAPVAEAIAPEVTFGAPAVAAPVAAVAQAPAAAPVASSNLTKINSAQIVAQTVAQPAAKEVKLTLIQRVAMKKVLKQVAKAESRQQNTASTTHAAATGGSLTVALVGLAALVIGLIVSSGFLITVGSIVLVVGLVLFILKAL